MRSIHSFMDANIAPDFSRFSPIVDLLDEIIANPKDTALALLQNATLVPLVI